MNVTSQSPHRASHTHTVVVHLTLSLRCQVSAPADDLTVFPSSTEQSSALQSAQSEHAAFVGSGLSHDLKGLCGKWKTNVSVCMETSEGQSFVNLKNKIVNEKLKTLNWKFKYQVWERSTERCGSKQFQKQNKQKKYRYTHRWGTNENLNKWVEKHNECTAWYN